MENKKNLFINKWWFWIIYLPWAVYAKEIFSHPLGLVIFGPPCLALLCITIVQEALYRVKSEKIKGFQFALSVIKSVILTACACFYAYASMAGSAYRLIHMCTVCMMVIGGVLEIVHLTKVYKIMPKGVWKKSPKKKASKWTPCIVYFSIWLASLGVFWLGGAQNAMGYSILFFYIILPLSIFVCSLLIGKDKQWRNGKWVMAIMFGIAYMLIEYATFSTANMLMVGRINTPQFEMILSGTIIAFLGMFIGLIIKRIRR